MNAFWVGVAVGGIVVPCLALVGLFVLFTLARVGE